MTKQIWRAIARVVIAAVVFGVVLLPGTNVGARGTGSHASIKRGGTVQVVWGPAGSWTKNFNPYQNTPTNGTLDLIYEPLLYNNEMKGGKLQPWLATGYKWSNGNKTLTFTLRKGVKWNDGKPFTSADVKFSFMLAKSNPAIACGNCWATLSSISTPNAHTVVFHLKTVDTTMLFYLGTFLPVPQHIWSTVSDVVKFTNPNPVGTGPFKLGSFSPQVFTLVRNKYYWQKGRPYVNALRFPTFTTNAPATLAAVKGEIDWAGLQIPDAQKVYASKSKFNHFWFQDVGAAVSIWMNNTKAPFNNVHVRRAIALAIDRKTVAKVAEYSYTGPGNAGFVLPNLMSRWADPAVLRTLGPTAAVAKARAELAKAKGVNTSATYTITCPTGWSDWQTSIQLIASELRAIGLKVTVQSLAFGDYLSHLTSGNYDLAMSWMAAGPSPYYTYRDDFSKSSIPPKGASANFARYSNSKLEKILSTYRKTTSPAKQVQLMKQAQAILASDVPIAPLFAGGDLWGEDSTRVFTGWPSKSNPYAILSPYHAPSNLLVALTIHRK